MQHCNYRYGANFFMCYLTKKIAFWSSPLLVFSKRLSIILIGVKDSPRAAPNNKLNGKPIIDVVLLVQLDGNICSH